MKIKLDGQGLVPAIAQDINTGQVLMLGYMNPGSLKRTIEGARCGFTAAAGKSCGTRERSPATT